MTLPPSMRCGNSINHIIDHIYPGVVAPQSDGYFSDHTMLSARNDDMDEINQLVLSKLPAQRKIYQSADSAEVHHDSESDEPLQYPPEYLNSINASGLPLAKLSLK